MLSFRVKCCLRKNEISLNYFSSTGAKITVGYANLMQFDSLQGLTVYVLNYQLHQ